MWGLGLEKHWLWSTRDNHTALCFYRDYPLKYRTEQSAVKWFCINRWSDLVIRGWTCISNDKLLRRKHSVMRGIDRNAMHNMNKKNCFTLFDLVVKMLVGLLRLVLWTILQEGCGECVRGKQWEPDLRNKTCEEMLKEIKMFRLKKSEGKDASNLQIHGR